MKRWIPTRQQILASRWIAPIAHHLEDEHLWHMDRGSVSRGVAIGLFFGFLLPVLQFLFAIVTAIILRGNVAIAAAATLVTNPLTFAPVYWLAYRIGYAVLGKGDNDGSGQADVIEAQTAAVAESEGWIFATLQTLQNAGAPLIVGLVVLAVVSSALGFMLVWLLWRSHKPAPHQD